MDCKLTLKNCLLIMSATLMGVFITQWWCGMYLAAAGNVVAWCVMMLIIWYLCIRDARMRPPQAELYDYLEEYLAEQCLTVGWALSRVKQSKYLRIVLVPARKKEQVCPANAMHAAVLQFVQSQCDSAVLTTDAAEIDANTGHLHWAINISRGDDSFILLRIVEGCNIL